MTVDDMRREMDDAWSDFNRAADELRDPFHALEQLRRSYERLEPADRQLAEQVIGDWVLDGEEAKRYDALALIGDLHLVSAVSRLRELRARLETASDPGAPYERERVDRLLDRLEGEVDRSAGGPPE